MCEWFMAKVYDNIMQDAEDKGLRDWRQQLLQNISGDVLELGCGTGANLEFYPDTVKRLVLIEPSAHMRKKMQAKIASCKQANIEHNCSPLRTRRFLTAFGMTCPEGASSYDIFSISY